MSSWHWQSEIINLPQVIYATSFMRAWPLGSPSPSTLFPSAMDTARCCRIYASILLRETVRLNMSSWHWQSEIINLPQVIYATSFMRAWPLGSPSPSTLFPSAMDTARCCRIYASILLTSDFASKPKSLRFFRQDALKVLHRVRPYDTGGPACQCWRMRRPFGPRKKGRKVVA
jgi:hypothetical protein